MNTFPTLLKREYWEHRGGLFWAPVWTAVVMMVMLLFGIVVAEIALRNHGVEARSHVHVGMDLNAFMTNFPDDKVDELKRGFDVGLVGLTMPLRITLFFVMLFYCIGSLYDERKDRSVLFWKSLPVSDSETVLSKVASALVVAPAIAIAVAVVTMFAFLALMSIVVLFHGGNPVHLLWGPGNPLAVAGHFIASLPIYALWALPTVGWLMLCSAWARTKPFLWAVMIPVFAGIFVAWFDIMNVFNLDTAWFWQHVVARALTSVFPGMWLTATDVHHVQGPEQLSALIGLKQTYSVLASPQLWVGAVAGAAMIFGAIRLRRWRDDN